VDIWRDVTEHFPRNPRAWNNHGEGLSAASGRAAAAAEEDKAKAQEALAAGRAEEAERYVARANEHLAESRRKLIEARDAFARAIQVKPDLPDAHYNLGKAYYELKDYEKAKAHYLTAQRLAPWDLPSFIMLGNLYVDQGRLAEAEHQFRLAIKAARPDTDKTLLARAYYNLGNTLARENRIRDAVVEYQNAIAAHPKYPNGHYGLGWALEQLGESDRALEAYATAARLNPDYAEAKNALTQLKLKLQSPASPAARP
jgi:tetratricopeptide (TPR) repeat protein